MLNFNHLMIWKIHQKTIFLRFLPKILFWWYFHRLYSFSSSTNFRVGGFSFSPTDLYISYSDFYSQHPWCLTSSFKNSILKIQNLSRLYFYSTFLGKPKLVEIKRLQHYISHSQWQTASFFVSGRSPMQRRCCVTLFQETVAFFLEQFIHFKEYVERLLETWLALCE